MGFQGVGFNRGAAAAMTTDIQLRLGELEAQCHALARRAFNIRSPLETSTVLYEELKLTLPKGWKPAGAMHAWGGGGSWK
jgi:DNA polymerase I-like protein with 3'-5' exonuclease and polymerase domains